MLQVGLVPPAAVSNWANRDSWITFEVNKERAKRVSVPRVPVTLGKSFKKNWKMYQWSIMDCLSHLKLCGSVFKSYTFETRTMTCSAYLDQWELLFFNWKKKKKPIVKHSDAKICISPGSPDLQRGKVSYNWLQGWNFHLEVETFTSPSAEKRSYLFLDQETFQTHIRSPKFLHAAAAAKPRQSYLTLCDPIDVNPAGSSVPGIFQARVLEWGAIAFSENVLHSRGNTSINEL